MVWIPSLLLLSLLVLPAAAQEAESDDFEAPLAWKRDAALTANKKDLTARYRKALREGAGPAMLIDALEYLSEAKESDDIALIARYIVHIEPPVADAAMDGLRAYGRAALEALENIKSDELDEPTRKKVREQLLRDHIRACCHRDLAVNPYHLDYEGRTAELFSVPDELDDLMLKMLRDSIADVRQDIAGTRYSYYRYTLSFEEPFIDYGALVVAALVERKPELMKREFDELTKIEDDQRNRWWYSSNGKAPVTTELAKFFARNGKTELIDRIISDIESGFRWRRPKEQAPQLVQIAAMQMVGLQDHELALETLDNAVKNLSSSDSAAMSHAQYLRARVLMKLGEEGAAMHALEEAMEASDVALVIALVDSVFKALEDERRFKAVQKYCRLAARRLPEGQRPWSPDAR